MGAAGGGPPGKRPKGASGDLSGVSADRRYNRWPVHFLPLILAVHITLAIALFLPSILLPLVLRRRPDTQSPGRFVQALLAIQAHGTVVIGVGLAVTGVLLLSVLGPSLLTQPWLLVALTIYALNLALAFFIQRPNLRRLVGVRAAADDKTWLERARRQRYVSYLMAGLVGTIGFLMSSKPVLW